jgi:hypothetical protein
MTIHPRAHRSGPKLLFHAFLHANRFPPRIQCGEGFRPKTLYLLAFALRASAITCSNCGMVRMPGTRNLPTMKAGVP